LIIDQIGKDISGTGMDTNVVGRKFHAHEPAEDELPKIKQIFVRSLTPEPTGNATGVGLANSATVGCSRKSTWRRLARIA